MKSKYYEKFLQGCSPFDLELEAIRANYVYNTVFFHPHKHILDIGSGPYAGFLKFNGWETYTVVEPIPEFCDILTSNAIGKPGIKIINSTLEEAGLPNKTYDCVLLSSVLHLVKDDVAFLNIVHDVCSEKNIVHVNTPNKQSLHRILGQYMGILPSLESLTKKDLEFGHYHVYSKVELKNLLTSCGFDVRQAGSYLLKPFDDEKMSIIADRQVVRGLEKIIFKLPDYGCEIFVEAKAIV